MNPGREIEDVVENPCKRSFFADFTIKRPKYYKLGGQQKEAADLLVAFKDTLLAIQIKSKQLHSSPARTGPIEQARVTKTIDKAIHQFRALVEAMRNRNFTSFVNGRGIEVPFNKSELQEIHLIVVFAPLNGEDIDRPTSIRFNASCQSQARIPLHLFTLKQFELLLTLLDTLPDFLAYLAARWMLHAKRLIPEDSDPIDEWALITFERKKLVEMLRKQTFSEISGLADRHRISTRRLERREKLSYFVDQLMEGFHGAVGLDLPVDKRFKLLAKPNSLKAYDLAMFYLAALNRDERSRLTEFLLNRVKACRRKPIAFRGVKFGEESVEGYVVLASHWAREERRIALYNVAMGVGLKLKAKTIIGFAVGHDWPDSPTCDAIVLDASNMKVGPDLKTLAELAFGKARIVDRK